MLITRPPPAADHRRHGGLAAQEDAGRVDLQGAPPGLLGHLHDRCGANRCAGVVDQNIEPAKPVECGLDQRRHRIGLRHVTAHRQGLSAQLLHFGGNRLLLPLTGPSVEQVRDRRAQVTHHHIGAIGRQTPPLRRQCRRRVPHR
ncbi:MAG: hypothetical protein HZY76_15495 [Anaerolineae bacterium]|nr:MAG: hypothetical protein HZY76_15495 [Anaerolineae bacterium]